MISRFRHLPFAAKISFILAIYTLAISIVGNMSLIDHVGEADIGVLRYWSPVEQCYRVSPTCSPKWPALKSGELLINDCLTKVDGLNLRDEENVETYLMTIYTGNQASRYVVVEGKRNGETFQTAIIPVRWSLGYLLRGQLLMIIPGLALWLTGLMVLVADPRKKQNRSLANFLLLGGMTVMGADQWFRSDQITLLYDFLANSSPRPFFGVLILQLALLFPHPVKNRKWLWITSIFWFLAILAAGFKFAEFFLFYDQPQMARILEMGFNGIVLLNFLVGSGVFVLRSLYLWKHPPTLKVRKQVPFLVIAWLTSLPLLSVDALSQIPGHSWALTHLTNLTVAGWIIPGAAMLAYAMLRYQAFAYRGQFLGVLITFFISVTIVQIYSMVIMPGGLDGLQWTLVWGAVLITTLLFYINTPIRRGFIRLFARHNYDYEIVSRFSQTIRKHMNLTELLNSAAGMLCGSLEVDWVGTWSPLLPETFFLAQNGMSNARKITIHAQPADDLFPTPPVHVEHLEEGEELLGAIWFGPRSTAEPFDEQDMRLAGLLGQDLARAIAVRSYIEQLEATPGVILEAVDSERRRIGQDIHDGVLQFLGGVTLSLDRAKRLWGKNPVKSEAILDNVIDQAQVMTKDARELVYDLSLPGVREGRFVDLTRQQARAVCEAAGVTLGWSVRRIDLWQELRGEQAVHVYRIIQESLYNAIRHASPTHISVMLDVIGDDYVVEITNDGHSIPQDATKKRIGLGLISMRERARTLEGKLTIISRKDGGAVVRLTFPRHSEKSDLGNTQEEG